MRTGILGLLVLLGAHGAAAQSNDVTFFVIGKHANFAHVGDDDPAPVDFSFFSEIFLTGGGDASEATLTFPTGEIQPFNDMRVAEGGDRDNLLLVSGEDRFTRGSDLTERYPDGDYTVSFATPSGDVAALLTFQPRPLPPAPRVTVRQEGRTCDRFDAGKDLVISWSDFDTGRSDPNEILDDLIFVILTNADGERIAHSGRPFENRPYLTYASTEFRIDQAVLEPGASYTLSVEHALLDDTAAFDGVPGFTTRAVTTKRNVTTGDAQSGCR